MLRTLSNLLPGLSTFTFVPISEPQFSAFFTVKPVRRRKPSNSCEPHENVK